MTLAERLRRDAATLRRLDRKKRWLFIWDYYKIPIIFFILAAVIGLILVTGITHGNADLYVVMVNANSEVESGSVPNLLEKYGIDLADLKIDVETGYALKYDDFTETDVQTVEVPAVRFGIGDLDVFVADEAVLIHTLQGCFY